MKILKTFEKFNQQIILPNQISIGDFVDRLNEKSRLSIDKETIVNWWENNLRSIKIHYFPFKLNQIMGCFLPGNIVCINSKSYSVSDIKLFIALHESKHVLQDKDDTMKEKYFKTVLNGDKEEFLINYRILENEANTFAINACKEMGFNNIVSSESKLRMNESMGEMVYTMMKNDIEKTGSTQLHELLLSQIL